ncbi:MAG: CBS domain-containing protein [Anaerolineales bacterium]
MTECPKVRKWMTPNPITITVDTPLMDAHRIMTENRVRRLPVLADGEIIGIVTLGDIRGAEPSEATSLNVWELNYLLSRTTVARVMSRPVITVPLDTSIADAAQLMLENRIAGLPVVDGGALVGIITESDIFRMVVEEWRQPAAPVPA